MNSKNWMLYIFYLVMFGVPTLCLGMFLSINNDVNKDNPMNGTCVGIVILIYLAVIVFMLSAFISGKTKAENIQKENLAKKYELEYAEKKYLDAINDIAIPTNAKTIRYQNGIVLGSPLSNQSYDFFVWISNRYLFFFPTKPTSSAIMQPNFFAVSKISLENIEYFAKKGEVYRENKIIGGGGGGSSIGGAIAGGLIAGETGAVIGSRQKVNEIKSELITHDTRETFLNYFDGGERRTVYFDKDAFNIFNDLMPEKEFNIVNAVKSSELIKNQLSDRNQKSVTDQLRELAKLRDDGIITEDEFNEKKKQLLDKIS